MKTVRRTAWIAVLALLAGMFTLQAEESLSDIKDRMAKRLPVINELKREQVVGENNEGYLTVLKSDKMKDKELKAVKDENVDRRKVYEYIAEKTGSSVELVGQRRAVQIVKQSAVGIMLQDQNGEWYEKRE